ncbi:MAG: hypothetical protein JWQ73_1135 [Variovorax sp.]|jgi:hypothetical protein|nr:hypothetical protein [Variovorax sp.]
MAVAHQVVVNCMRYLLEHMDEPRSFGIDGHGSVPYFDSTPGTSWSRC